MGEIKRYVFTKDEEINEGKWFHGEEDLNVMLETMENVIKHYKDQGIEFWHKIMVDNYDCLCYIGKTKEIFEHEYAKEEPGSDFTKAKHLEKKIYEEYVENK